MGVIGDQLLRNLNRFEFVVESMTKKITGWKSAQVLGCISLAPDF